MGVNSGSLNLSILGLHLQIYRMASEKHTSEIDDFAKIVGLTAACGGQFSTLLTEQLWSQTYAGQINPAKVILEIEALEGIGRGTRTKTATVYRRSPLKNLWHKHFQGEGLQAVAYNVQKGMRRYGSPLFASKSKEAADAGEMRYVQLQDIPALVNDLVQKNYERVAADQALTGDWLIFAKYQGRNYYLCVAKHATGDEAIRAEIDRVCVPQFPFLGEILQPMLVR